MSQWTDTVKIRVKKFRDTHPRLVTILYLFATPILLFFICFFYLLFKGWRENE